MASRWLLERLHRWTVRDLCPHPNRRGRSWGFFHFPEHRAGSGRTQWRGRGSYLDLHLLLEGCVSYWTDWPWTFSHFSPSRRGRWVTQTFFSRWCLLDYLWPLSKLSRPKQQPWFLCSLSHCHLWLHRRSRSLYPPASYHLHHCRLRNLERFGHHWWVLRLGKERGCLREVPGYAGWQKSSTFLVLSRAPAPSPFESLDERLRRLLQRLHWIRRSGIINCKSLWLPLLVFS